MLRTYMMEFSMPSGYITPWHADTIFGHLCWVAENNDGFSAFKGATGLIDLFKDEKPPFIISDAFPSGFLPAPANLNDFFSIFYQNDDPGNKYSAVKDAKSAEVLTFDQFESWRKGIPFDPIFPSIPIKSTMVLHNTINRFSGTTGDEGGLYEQEEKFTWNGKNWLFIKSEDGLIDDVKKLFELLSRTGFGKKKATGKGVFKILLFNEFMGFENISDAEYFISLSHFIPAQSDPVEGWYKTTVKYGKMGGERVSSTNPFKKPLLMLCPGAVFKTGGQLEYYYGRMIKNVSYTISDVVQYAYSFPLPCKY